MKFTFALSKKSKSLLFTAIKIYLPAFVFIILVWRISKLFGVEIYQLTADPAAVGGQPPYTGLITNIGNLLWCGTATICIFSAFLTKLEPACSRRWFTFLLNSFFLTTVLLLDDMFQVHEYYHVLFGFDGNLSRENRLLQNLFEALFFIVYLVWFVFYIFYFRKHIRRSEYLFIVLAFLFFGLSIVIDMTPETVKYHHLMEEGCKLLGIVSWLTYFSRTCSSVIRQLIANQPFV